MTKLLRVFVIVVILFIYCHNDYFAIEQKSEKTIEVKYNAIVQCKGYQKELCVHGTEIDFIKTSN